MMRRLLLLLLLLAASAGAAAQSFSIARTSGSTFYIDASAGLYCSYVSYRITATGGAVADAWADIGSFTGGNISPAANEMGTSTRNGLHLGAFSAGQTRGAFFYLCATGAATGLSDSHTVRVLSNAPNLSPTVWASSTFQVNTVADSINANANKVTVVTSGPNPPTIGGIITMTVSGSTGTMSNPPFIYFTPAVQASWPAGAIRLVSSSVSMSGGNNLTLTDTLFADAANGFSGTSNTSYTATYTFVAMGTTSITTSVEPINYIASGGQPKHTDTAGLASLAPIQPVSNSLQVLKTANRATLPATGGTVTYTLRTFNNSSGSVALDQMVDLLPASPAAASYVPGSSRFNGVAVADPVISGSTATWSGTFTVPGGGSSSLTFDVAFPATAGLYTNRGYGLMGSTVIDSTFATTDSAPSSVATRVYAAPGFSKSFSPNAIAPGGAGISTLTFTIANATPAPMTGVQFSDSLPQSPGSMAVAAVPVATASNCGAPTFAPAAGATSISFTGGTIAANSTCTVTVNVTAAVSGAYNNTSGALTANETGAIGTASATLTVTTQPAVVKSFAPATIPVNGTSRLAIVVTNNNATAIGNVAFSDPLPAGMLVAAAPNSASTCGGSASFPAAGANGTISVTGGSIAAGGSCSVAVDVTAAAAGTYTNIASGASSTETGAAGPASPAQTLTVLDPPAIAKAFSPSTASTNERTTLTFTLTNANPLHALTGVAFTDALPSSPGAMAVASPSNLALTGCGALATASASGSALSLSGAEIAAGSTCTLRVDVTAPAVGTYDNVSSAVTSSNGGTGNTASASLVVTNRPTVAKSFSVPAIPATGATATYATASFTVTNNSTGLITGVAFTDALPSGLSIAPTPTVSNGCSSGGGVVQTSANGSTWTTPTAGHTHLRLTGASLAAGASCTVTIRMTSSAAGTYDNVTSGVTSSVNATPGNPSNTATLQVLSPVVTMLKGFSPSTVSVGAATQLTITLVNPNSIAVSGVAVQDSFPSSPGAMTLSSATVANTCGGSVQSSGNGSTWTAVTAGHAHVRLTGGTVPANGNCAITFLVSANAGGSYNNVTGAVTASVGGFTYTGNTAGAVLTVNTAPSVAKTFVPSSIVLGGNARVDFVVTNGNGGAISSIAFSDAFPASPAQMTYVGTVSNTCGGTLAAIGGGALAAGAAGFQLTGGGFTGTTCTVSLDVTAPAAGSYANQTSAVSASTGTGSASNSAILSVVAPPTVAKQFSVSSVPLNGTATLTLTLANPAANPVALTGVALTDAFPAGLQVAATPAFSSNCGGTVSPGAAAGDTSLALSGGAIAPGASCTIQVNVTATTAGSKVNTTAAVTSANGGTGNTASATLDVVAPPSVAKAFSVATTSPGNPFDLTITITNPAQNGVALTGLSLTDALPAGLQVAPVPGVVNACGGSITSGSVPGDTTITLAGGAVAASSSCQVRVTLVATTTGLKANTTQAVQSANGGAGNTAAASITVYSPLTIAKAFSPASIGAGGTSTVTVTLTNASGVAVANAGFTDAFPAAPGAMTLASATTTNTCGGTLTDASGGALAVGSTGVRLAGASLANGASCAVTFTVTAAAVGSYANTIAAVTSDTLGSNAGATANLAVLARPVVTKAFGAASVSFGSPTTLTITLANPNAATTLNGVAFTDVFPVAPGAMTLADTTVASTCGGTLTANGGAPLAAGSAGIQLSAGVLPPAGCAITVNVTAAAPGSYTNTLAAGAVTTTEAGASTAAATASVTFAQATLAKAFTPAAIDVGGVSTLVFTIANGSGNPAQSGIAFTDTLPAGVAIAGTPNVLTNCPAGGALAAPGFTVTAGAGTGSVAVSGAAMNAGVASCEIRVDVTSATAGTHANLAANISAMQRIDAAAVNAALTVRARPSLTKAFGASALGLGQSTTLAFSIANTGTNAVNRTGLSFTDTLPAGLVIANPPAVTSTSCGTPSFTAADGTQPFTAASISVDAGQTCTLTLTVRGTTTGAKVNGAAQITAISGIDNAVTDQAVTVVQASLTKAFAPATISVGGTSTLTFTLANGAGNPAQAGIGFTDTLPANVVVAAAPNVQTNCPAGGAFAAPGFGVTATAGTGSITVAGAALAGAVASCQVRVDVTSSTVGTYTNDAASLGGLANVANAVVASTLTVTGSAPSVAKAFAPAEIGVGNTALLTITLGNANAVPLTAAAFTDTYPASVVNAATPAGATTCAGGSVTAVAGEGTVALSGATLPAGGSCMVTVTVTSATPGSHVNTLAAGAVTTANAGASAAPASATLTVLPRPTVAKAFSLAVVGVGQASTLTITLGNGSSTPMTGAAFTDAYPANVVNAATPAAATTCAGGSVTAVAGEGSVALSGGTIPPNGSCTVTVGVVATATGSFVNTIAAGGVTTTNAGASVVAATDTLTTIVAPTAAKSFTPAAIAPGGTSVLAITLANPNTIAITGAAFTDSYPAGLVNTGTPNATLAGAGCTGTVTANPGGASLALAGATLPASSSCTVTVNVTATAAGAYVNSTGPIATANAGTGGAAGATLNVFDAPTVTKSFAPTFVPTGGTATLTIVVSNPATNPASLTGAAIADAYPAGLANSGAGSVSCAAGGSATLTGGLNGGTSVGFNGATIPAGGACTITQPVTTTANVTNTTGPATSNEAPAGVPASASLATSGSPSITKAFSPGTVALGGTSTITFTLTNPNPIGLTGGAFTDALAGMAIDATGAAGGTCAGAGGNTFTAGQANLSFAGLAVPASNACTVTIVVRGTAAGVHPNTTSGLASNQAPTGPPSNTASLTVTATAPTVAKGFAPSTIDPGGVSTLTVTIGNGNAAAITVTSLTDTYPSGVTTAAAPNASTTCTGGTVTHNAGSVTLTGGTVTAGGSCTVSIAVTSSTPGAAHVNVIPVGGLTTSIGANAVAASAILDVRPEADVSVAKSAPATVANGGTVTYTIVVSNAGPQGAGGAAFSDNVPAALTGVAASCGSATGGAACGAVNVSGNAVTSTIATLPAGGSVTFTITGTAPQSGTFTNTASAINPAGVVDPTDPGRTGAGNNTASANTTVVSPDLRVSKAHSGSFSVGVNGTYVITVDNTFGTAPTAGTITVVDTLPAGLGYLSATGTGWSCAAAGQVVTCTSSTAIAAGATSPNAIVLTVTVGSTAVGTVTNAVTVSGGNEPAANNGNNSAFDPTLVVAAAAHSFAPDNAQSAPPGTTVHYAHTFNAGSAGSVSFSASNIATPAVAGWTAVIYRDTDCSGTLNGAEGAAALSGAVAVNAGDRVCIVVRDAIPAAAPYNAQNAITVTATFGAQSYTRTDLTTVSGTAGAGLVLAKSVRNVTQGGAAGTSGSARPNDVLEYTITYTNTGSGALSSIVITDSTPSFTTFQAAACGAPLPGNITSCAVTTQPAVNGVGSVVWTLGGTLLSAGSGSVSYTVRVVP